MQRLQQQLEMAGSTATLYLRGALESEHLADLLGTCAGLPATVRTLRLDLRGLGQLSAEAIGVVREVLRVWRTERNGEFRLSTSHLVATLTEVSPPAPSPVCEAARRPLALPAFRMGYQPRMNDALAATYL